jgi:hypothetical protein
LRRWPTVVGVLFAACLAAAFWSGLSGTAEVAQVLTAAGCVYLGAAALGQRAAAWPLFAGTFVVIGAGFAAPGFDPLWAMVGMVAVLGTIGLVRGMLRPRWGMPLQAGAMAVIIGVAIAVTLVGQRWTGVLVGAALLAHAGWDVYHHRTRRVVAPSLAEFCAALDAILALAVIVLTLVR